MANHRLVPALRCLQTGGVIAYPTEAVFGLGCDPLNAEAVARLLAIKGRSADKGLILISHDRASLNPWLQPVPPALEDRLAASWPGPVTWVLPVQPWVPRWLTGSRDTLAVRVTAHSGAAALCRAYGGPLVSTSANRSGHPPARTALQARCRLGRRVDLVVPGPTGGLNRPSEIRDGRSGRVLRQG
ncbi:MAG: Sua5/YciO/YrdC/YwlC family protein [Ectothiorhodospiraceae bacterium]|nr:Sua5/YciO/YrdC/YwlC family protein [Ectothiorhodospiraceae bacterium]